MIELDDIIAHDSTKGRKYVSKRARRWRYLLSHVAVFVFLWTAGIFTLAGKTLIALIAYLFFWVWWWFIMPSYHNIEREVGK